MLAQLHLQLGAHRAREHDDAERDQRGEHDGELEGLTPLAAEVAHVVADGRHAKQIQAGDEQRGGMERGPAREAQLRDPVAPAPDGQEQQRHHQRVHQSAHLQGLLVDVAHEQRPRIQVQVEDERSGQAEAERLRVPARVLVHVAVQLFDEHEREDRQGQRTQENQRRLGRECSLQRGRPLREQRPRDKHAGHRDEPSAAQARLLFGAEEAQQTHVPASVARDVGHGRGAAEDEIRAVEVRQSERCPQRGTGRGRHQGGRSRAARRTGIAQCPQPDGKGRKDQACEPEAPCSELGRSARQMISPSPVDALRRDVAARQHNARLQPRMPCPVLYRVMKATRS